MGEESQMVAPFAFRGLRIWMSVPVFCPLASERFQKVTTVSFAAPQQLTFYQ